MSLVCAQCSRVNPEEAAYCYYDGAALAGRSGGPVNAGSAPFPSQFVFPNGTTCRNFDQLALACQNNWAAAVDLLKQGFLGSFFGGMGRVDLSMAAKEAALFPDIDRGLDQLLAKLPTQALQEPNLQAEPNQINLGQLKIGENRTTELHLSNLGMRLLYGNVTSDCKWLTIGEQPGQAEKIFQFGTESILHIQVRGQHLRAGNKPLEGHLTVDSNGGIATITIRADVSVTPYPGGLFNGAITPRQVAEKAKATPKEAAPYFEGGTVAKWYASNGWAYPVQGPTMSGMGSIQQFFEALGVAKPPKVSFSAAALDLRGSVGQAVQSSIEVTTNDRKVVYGWATCDQSWVEVGKTKLNGKTATIPITVRIPSPCPPTLEARLNVIGNGNQKQVVPLKVTVAGGKKGVVLEEVVEVAALDVVEEAVPVMELAGKSSKTTPPPVVAAAPAPVSPFAVADDYIPVVTATAVGPPPTPVEDNPFALGPAPLPYSASPVVATAPGMSAPATAKPQPMSMPVQVLVLVLPVALLCTCLLGLIVRDLLPHRYGGPPDRKVEGPPELPKLEEPKEIAFEEAGNVDVDHPRIKLIFDEGKDANRKYTDTMTFAVHKLYPEDPSKSLKLNWYDNGSGNSTVLRIDGKDDVVFGKTPAFGSWAKGYESEGKKAGKYGGKARIFDFNKGNISVTQTVVIAPGDVPEQRHGRPEKEVLRPLNVCFARYKIFNRDTKPHKVGLRVLLDTCIGERDGVPFLLPGEKNLITTKAEFVGDKVPDFIQILEEPNPAKPGVVVQLGMRFGGALEPASLFRLTHWPASGNKPDKKNLDKWDVPLTNFEDDSAVVMYWEEKELQPKQSREMAFSYGLGTISIPPEIKDKQNRALAVSVGGALFKGGEFTVIGLIADAEARSATLTLPAGLKALGNPTQTLPPRKVDGKNLPVTVTWRVQANDSGTPTITVSTDTGLRQSRDITITRKSLFN